MNPTIPKPVISWLVRNLVPALQAQLVATLVSLPFLVYWGLPLSVMSIVGNLAFTPLLIVFLLLSSLVFFTEVFGIPNGALVSCLDGTGHIWHALLHWGRSEWLFGFARPHPLILGGVAIASLTALWWVNSRRKGNLTLGLAVVLVGTLAALHGFGMLTRPMPRVPKNIDKVDVVRNEDGTIDVIDKGFFSRRRAVDSALDFELKPYLLTKYGTTRIGKIVLNKPNGASFYGATRLVVGCPVDSVVVPYFEDEISKYAWFRFFELKRTLEERGKKLRRT